MLGFIGFFLCRVLDTLEKRGINNLSLEWTGEKLKETVGTWWFKKGNKPNGTQR